MRSSAIIFAVTLVSSAAPSLAAPVPVPVNAESSSDLQARGGASAIIKLLPKLLGNITSKTAADTAFSGSPPNRRDAELAERAGASALVKPFVKGAAGSAAVGGFLGLIDKLFGGDQHPQKRDLAERAGAAGLIKPFVKGAAGSAALGGFFGAIDKLFGGEGNQKRATQNLDVDTMISTIEKSGAFSQEQLDEVEAELTKSLSSVHTRSLDTRAVRLGGLTKGILGVLGSVAGSLGIDAALGNNKRSAAPLTHEEMIAKIENSSEFTQAQLDQVEAELSKAMTGGLTSRSNLEDRAVKLGGLTKGIVGVIGSIVGSIGADAVFGGDKGARGYEDLSALD